MRAICLSILFFTACGGGDGSSSGVSIPQGVSGSCGTDAPSIVDFSIATVDLSETQSWIRLTVDVEDADLDLNYYELRAWFDSDVDGQVDTSADYLEIFGTLNPEPCSLPRTTLTMQMPVAGALRPDTDFEFGVIAYDDMGNPTGGGQPMVVAFRTPSAK